MSGVLAKKRLGSVMQLKPGKQGEYQRRHEDLWPEMCQALKAHGATNYSIFLHPETNQLFAYLEVADKERYEALAQTAICQKWWAYMEPLMVCYEDHRPKSVQLQEVFYLA